MKSSAAVGLGATVLGLFGGACSGGLLQDAPLVGLGSLGPIGTLSSGSSSAVSIARDESTGRTSGVLDDDETRDDSMGSTGGGGGVLEEDVIRALEVDAQITVVPPVEVGELLCDTLEVAEDAAFLSFIVHEGDTIVAEQSSYTVAGGDSFTDGIGRKVWTGTVIYPEQAEDEAVRRTVSMAWGEVCDTETFFLKVTKRRSDGTISLTKTVPYGGSTTHTCLVEVLMEFDESGDGIVIDEAGAMGNETSRGSTGYVDSTSGGTGGNANGPRAPRESERRLQDSSDTVIDIMVLYSGQALASLGGITSQQMETIICESLAGTNEAFANSGVSVSFNSVYIGLLPYEDLPLDAEEALIELRADAAVGVIRDTTGADLVQLVDDFDDGNCGAGYVYIGDETYGFSVVRATCIDNFSHTHEYGHNLGCRHDRDNTDTETDYAHGFRYCDGADQYRTLMSYSCGGPRVNYFSNPDVEYLNKPTGTAIEDNARAIEENMVKVSNFRHRPTTSPTPTPTTAPVPAPAPIPEPPTAYAYIGCYRDDAKGRVFSGNMGVGVGSMTTEACATFCGGSPYFGTEFGQECFCGLDDDDPAELGDTTCTFKCHGDASEACGGRNAISAYQYTGNYIPEIALAEYIGCWRDSKDARIMDFVLTDRFMTNELCESQCSGYTFYGTQYETECWCGDAATNYTVHGESTACDMACAGDGGLSCGGIDAMTVWKYKVVLV